MRRSGHSGGTGLTKDYEKLNLAASQGWRVFLLSGEMITAAWLESIATSIRHPSSTQSIPLQPSKDHAK